MPASRFTPSPLSRRLAGISLVLALAMPLSWLEQRLAEINQTTDQLVQLEAQQQAADQVTVSNSIGSLRLLAATDWSAFVESLSTVDKTLRTDPANTYSAMDFATRDTYRHAIEQIARDTNANEDNVAHAAIAAPGSLPGSSGVASAASRRACTVYRESAKIANASEELRIPPLTPAVGSSFGPIQMPEK